LHLIWVVIQNSAAYADQSIYCSAVKGISENMEILQKISTHIDRGNFDTAEDLCNQLLSTIEIEDKKTVTTYIILFNLAGFFVDLGHMAKRKDLSLLGLNLMSNHKESFLEIINPSSFFFNLANAKSNLISIENPFELTFQNIEELVELKNYYWKALKEKNKDEENSHELLVNLSNSLKRQFRLSESLRYYDIVNSFGLDIPQAHINRSETLKMLNIVSESYSVKMLQEVADGYKIASKSEKIPVSWAEYYRQLSLFTEEKIFEMGLTIGDDEKKETQQEYNNLSSYRKFCIEKHLTLSEHGLYCACAGSARDNLTIPLLQKSIGGKFVPQMEMVLNRIKSEYSLARRNYYDYHNPTEEDLDLLHEDCFTELLNNELLGIPAEKLRTSFRLCFGILDKIAMAICEIYNVKPKGEIYFQNFWRLDVDERRDKFESIKNPGLLALYSIATDLNMHKDGEWACFKNWRNSLEHGLFVILEEDSGIDIYESFTATPDIVKITLKEFLYFLEQLLQLTRSAIFSFVFSIRHLALQSNTEGGILCELNRKNFTDEDL
jgi:hypothetical protein